MFESILVLRMGTSAVAATLGAEPIRLLLLSHPRLMPCINAMHIYPRLMPVPNRKAFSIISSMTPQCLTFIITMKSAKKYTPRPSDGTMMLLTLAIR